MCSKTCNNARPCRAPPHPDVPTHVAEQFRTIDAEAPHPPPSISKRQLGLNDGTIFAPSDFPARTPAATMRQAAQTQPRFRGDINIAIVCVNFKENPKPWNAEVSQQMKYQKPLSANIVPNMRRLFFSKGAITTGSVTEYFSDVSGGKISLIGDVLGPYTLPQKMEYYANGDWGMSLGPNQPNCRTMASDTAKILDQKGIDMAPYDNVTRKNGYVDGFIIVHAGTEILTSQKKSEIWAHKWTISDNEYLEVGKSKTKVFSYMTVAEDVSVGVAAHEFGHLVFGWPDLYDVFYATDGIGAWCLMSWGCHNQIGDAARGTTPAHPSAWCKLQQGWVDAIEDDVNGYIDLNDVKAQWPKTINANRFGYIHKLWPNGQASGQEYFLIENRFRSGYDRSLPGDGLLIWHVDDAVLKNDSRLPHFKVALMSASGTTIVAKDARGSNQDPFPGTLGKREFTNSKTFAGLDTFIKVQNISDAGERMKMSIIVKEIRASRL